MAQSQPSSSVDVSSPVENPLEASASMPAPPERNPASLSRSLRLACQCAEAADETKGGDIVVLDLTKITSEFDYFVIATGNSRRQLHAIADEADLRMMKAGSKRLGIEGYNDQGWVLQDYGDVVLHVFDPETRELYDLERLWGDADRVDWQEVLKSSSV